MGTTTATPLPSLYDAMQEAENTTLDLCGVASLLRALAGSGNLIEAQALHPIADAVQAIQANADKAWEALFPILRAAGAPPRAA